MKKLFTVVVAILVELYFALYLCYNEICCKMQVIDCSFNSDMPFCYKQINVRI